MTVPTGSQKILLLTVGTGDRNRIEETLLTPLVKSIQAGPSGRVILVPSQPTKGYAEEVAGRFPELAIEIRTIPGEGDEYDADRCFAWIDGVLAAAIAEGHAPESIVVDFTRGTKSMSAAATLAAVSRGVATLRYVDGQRAGDPRGMVEAGTERLREIRPAVATIQAQLQRAMRFIESGQFAAAEALFPRGDAEALGQLPASSRASAAWAAWMAGFWGEWDRFYYDHAAEKLEESPALAIPAEWSRFVPTEANQNSVRRLAKGLPRETAERAGYVRHLAADVLANASRRLRWGQPEDALQRGYRVLEMAGQARLFQHGLDSENVDPNDPKVREWLEYKARKGKPVESRLHGRLTLGRDLVASLLKHMRDPLGKELTNPKAVLNVDIAYLRNLSILNHGFVSNTQPYLGVFERFLEGLRDLLRRDPDAERGTVEAAEFPFLPKSR